ncbi:SbtR family transcriptional regulator [Actinacidiphila acididurans]|uniref:SbtR family transcriptional regulator n=1 Tax=Actinacidiphila acididurans TaxID=2784346 RepID=UPI00355823ED
MGGVPVARRTPRTPPISRHRRTRAGHRGIGRSRQPDATARQARRAFGRPRGAEAGSLRPGIRPGEVAALMLGVFLSTAASDTPEQAGRLLDLVVDALRPK